MAWKMLRKSVYTVFGTRQADLFLFWSSYSDQAMEKIENDILERLISLDNGGRRSGGDRRNYSYTLHIPERRSGQDRRSGEDRRRFPRAKAKLQI